MDCKRRILLLLLLRRGMKQKQKKRRYCVNPYLAIMNHDEGHFKKKYEALKLCGSDKFYDYFRMSVSSFEELFAKISPRLHRQYVFRKPVEPLEMLGLTIRFLATGNTFVDVDVTNHRGKSTIGKIVREVCCAIWDILLSESIPRITEKLLEQIAAEFYKKTKYPNCIGALDGKHVRVGSTSSGSHLNESYNSIVLLALVDSKYRFLYVDIGAYCKESDSTDFHNTKLYKLLLQGTLPVPEPKPLPGFQTPVPHVFVADEGLPLTSNVMGPYTGECLTKEEIIFNYRLSRARRYIECTFGIMANKWEIFHRPLNVQCDFAMDIIKACCVLHNFIINRDGVTSSEELFIDDSFLDLQRSTDVLLTNPVDFRSEFCKYFTSDGGALSWQLSYI